MARYQAAVAHVSCVEMWSHSSCNGKNLHCDLVTYLQTEVIWPVAAPKHWQKEIRLDPDRRSVLRCVCVPLCKLFPQPPFPAVPGRAVLSHTYMHARTPAAWHDNLSLSKPSDQVVNSLSPSLSKAPDVTEMKVNVQKSLCWAAPWLIRAISQPSRSRHFPLPQPSLSFFISISHDLVITTISSSLRAPALPHNDSLLLKTFDFVYFFFLLWLSWFYFEPHLFFFSYLLSFHVLPPCVRVKIKVRGAVWLKGVSVTSEMELRQ